MITPPPDSRRAIVHVGTHKTGSTSLQHLLFGRGRSQLRAAGIEPFVGGYIPHNHVELHLPAMRPERQSGFKLRNAIQVDDRLIATTLAEVAGAAAATPLRTMLFSAEGLSLLRYPDEFARLRQLLAPFEVVEIVIVLRDPATFLASYRAQLGPLATTDPARRDDFCYVGPDSWLADYAPRLALFRQTFGAGHVHAIDYDAAVAADRSIIPAFVRTIGLDHFITETHGHGPFLNRRTR
jgi:hypothetical protein